MVNWSVFFFYISQSFQAFIFDRSVIFGLLFTSDMFLFCDSPIRWENQRNHNHVPRSRSEWSREWLKRRREIQERRKTINMVNLRRKTIMKALDFLEIKAAHEKSVKNSGYQVFNFCISYIFVMPIIVSKSTHITPRLKP